MMGAHLLPGEGRAAPASVDEARETAPRFRSIRARFEHASGSSSNSATASHAPERTRARAKGETKAQAELAAFLKKNADRDDSPKNVPQNNTVGSLIQQWSGDPLAERDLQRVHEPIHREETDTFGDLTHELDLRHPKTDPGQLESYAKLAVNPNPHNHVPASSDQSLRELFTPNPRAPQTAPPHERTTSSIRRSISTTAITVTTVTDTEEVYPYAQSAAQADEANDWGAADAHIQELFREAEETAERAVQCDEQEEYFEAFELYWVVVELYYKVIPFLSQEEGVDVHERIKMYTRRCEAIRSAFDEDPDADTAEHIHNEQVEAPSSHDVVDPMPGSTHPPFSLVSEEENRYPSQQEQRQTRSVPREQVDAHRTNGKPPVGRHRRSQSGLETQFATHASIQNSQPISEDVNKPRQFQNIQRAQEQQQELQRQYKEHQEMRKQQRKEASNLREVPSNSHTHPTPAPFEQEFPLVRSRLPDYNTGELGQTIPDAPRGPPGAPAISVSTQAHRNSLSRPISKNAVRASTNSVSREKMDEMQKRVQVMQDCLNNFTVKRKHLGPARALELQITTLNANTFGDLKRLEPLPAQLEHTWSTELEVLLSMLQEIKEVRLGQGNALREDIAKHLPALEKCDKSVRKTMRSFSVLKGHVEYVDRETAVGGSAKAGRSRRRWWVKVPVVKQGGLSPDIKQVVEEAEREMKGVFKIAHEINLDVVKEMKTPVSFVEGLPKHARSLISKELKEALTVWGVFKISDFMKDRNMWTREHAKDITSKLEKVSLIWEAKTRSNGFFSRTLDFRGERMQQAMTAYRRCQTSIRELRKEWPTMQHTDLDMAKIESNDDIGHAGLEAYSRALESRAYRLLTRIRELLDADEEERRHTKLGSD